MVSRHTHAYALPAHTNTSSHTTGGAGPIHSDQTQADLFCGGFWYNAKTRDLIQKLSEVVAGLPYHGEDGALSLQKDSEH